MILTQEQINELERTARPLIEYLNSLGHPHFIAIVESSRVELLESKCSRNVTDYIKD